MNSTTDSLNLNRFRLSLSHEADEFRVRQNLGPVFLGHMASDLGLCFLNLRTSFWCFARPFGLPSSKHGKKQLFLRRLKGLGLMLGAFLFSQGRFAGEAHVARGRHSQKDYFQALGSRV